MQSKNTNTKIRQGLYKVGTVETFDRRNPTQTAYVVLGEVLNEATQFGMKRVRGVYDSKWFVYLVGEYEWVHADNSGTSTLPIGTIEDGPFSRKAEAVRVARQLLTESA